MEMKSTCLLAFGLLAAAPAAAFAERYSIRQMLPIPARSHDQTSLAAIDEAGNAVGASRSSAAASASIGQVLRADGTHLAIGALADCLPYGGSGLHGASPAGVITGEASSVCGGFARTISGVVSSPASFTTFGPLPGGGDCSGYDANADAIVGWSNLQQGCVGALCVFTNGRPMKWYFQSPAVQLPSGGFVASAAYGINAAGVAVGIGLSSQTYDSAVGLRWDTDTSNPAVLPAVNGSYSYAFRISDAGVVVGESDDGPSRRATRWVGANATSLGALPGHGISTAIDIDDRRGIVGSSRVNAATTSLAVLFRDGLVIDLNERLTNPNGVVLTSANGINANGWIAANGTLAGKSFGFVLVPCFADLTADDLVDDSDFLLFVAAYDQLDCADPAMPVGCPSDLNRDGVVDDADFQVFVLAYNELLCP
jgi:uncharacterized membrane protein